MTLFAREPPGPFGTYGGRALCTDSLAHARSTKPGYRAPLVCQHAATREHADRWASARGVDGRGRPARAARAGRAGAEEQGASIKASYQHASGGHRESLPAGKRPRRRGTTTRCHPHGTHGLDRRGRRHQWGRACSPCRGKSIPAASLGSPSVRGGISGIEVIGNVYKLTRSEDVSGHDTAVSASAVLADGGDVATMRNQHGVVINLAGTSRGANILVGVQGMKITVEGAPTASTRP